MTPLPHPGNAGTTGPVDCGGRGQLPVHLDTARMVDHWPPRTECVEWGGIRTADKAGSVMRRLPNKLVTLLVAVVVVGGLALVGSAIRSTPATPAPDVAAPTPDSPAQSWQAFQTHVASSLPGLEADINALASAGTAGDDTAAASAAGVVKTDATSEVAWLRANPAALCYQAVYGDYLSANQTLEKAMTDAISGDHSTADALLGQLNTSLASLADDTAKTAC
jgi:hypothetical protein